MSATECIPPAAVLITVFVAFAAGWLSSRLLQVAQLQSAATNSQPTSEPAGSESMLSLQSSVKLLLASNTRTLNRLHALESAVVDLQSGKRANPDEAGR